MVGNVSEGVGRALVNTPMNKRIPLTTDPRSPELRFALPETMMVPAKLFGDVVTMTAEIGVAGHRMRGPRYVAMAGDDRVATNFARILSTHPSVAVGRGQFGRVLPSAAGSGAFPGEKMVKPDQCLRRLGLGRPPGRWLVPR